MNVAMPSTETARQIAESIATLPPLPATAQEILRCFGDEFIDADKVSSVVEGDPGICAKLLGLSNSAYFGLAEPVGDIREAISRVLGVDTVRSLVLAMAIQRSFSSRNCPSFDTLKFWTHSVLTSECCKKIALADKDASHGIRDLASSAGLCHNLGLMALAHLEPERTNSVLNAHARDEESQNLADVFHGKLDFDHRTMTAELTRFWSLPEQIVSAYEYRAFGATDGDKRLGEIVAAAAVAVASVELVEDVVPDLSEFSKPLGMSSDELIEIANFSDKQKERLQSLSSNMSG